MKVSVIITTYNRPGALKRVLQGLLGQTRVPDEIVIADTGSTDRSIEIAQKFDAKIIPIKWTNNFSDARNKAKAHCSGDWILMLDADETISFRDLFHMKQLLETKNETPTSTSTSIPPHVAS